MNGRFGEKDSDIWLFLLFRIGIDSPKYTLVYLGESIDDKLTLRECIDF